MTLDTAVAVHPSCPCFDRYLRRKARNSQWTAVSSYVADHDRSSGKWHGRRRAARWNGRATSCFCATSASSQAHRDEKQGGHSRRRSLPSTQIHACPLPPRSHKTPHAPNILSNISTPSTVHSSWAAKRLAVIDMSLRAK